MNHSQRTTKSLLLIFLFTFLNTFSALQAKSHSSKTEHSIGLINQLENYLLFDQKLKNKAGMLVQSMGADADCDINVNVANIQLVIGSGATEIRLANNATYNEDIFISDQSLIIKGGYANCADANNDNVTDGKTLITGTGNEPVIKISGSSNNHDVLLQNLIITGGQGSDFFPGGGVSTLNADANIKLLGVIIDDNSGNLGGGIAISSGATDLILEDTLIKNNESITKGGGIYCDSEDASILMIGQSGVANNKTTSEANGLGGGIYVEDCNLSVFSGSQEIGTELGIANNTATREGGGIYALSSDMTLQGQSVCIFNVCFGDPSQPINISGNTAENNAGGPIGGNGGGINITGGNLNITGVLINNNVAHYRGGGMVLNGNVQVNIRRQNSTCWDLHKCNLIKDNFSLNAANIVNNETYGGAVYLYFATLDVENTYFEGNRADFGTVIWLNSESATAVFKGSVFHNNGNLGIGLHEDDSLFSIWSSQAHLSLINSTVADNDTVNAVIYRENPAWTPDIIEASIIHEPTSGFVLSHFASANIDIDCLVAHESVSLGGSATNVIVADPQFKDRVNGNFHLDATSSPAVDLCAQPLNDDSFLDMDNQARGWDDPDVVNHQSNPNFVYDAGADETYDNDIIFKDGFDEN